MDEPTSAVAEPLRCANVVGDGHRQHYPIRRRDMRRVKSTWEIAVDTYGEDHIEVMAIADSWGDTMDDEEVLAALRKLNSTGSIFDDITIRVDGE